MVANGIQAHANAAFHTRAQAWRHWRMDTGEKEAAARQREGGRKRKRVDRGEEDCGRERARMKEWKGAF